MSKGVIHPNYPQKAIQLILIILILSKRKYIHNINLLPHYNFCWHLHRKKMHVHFAFGESKM